MGQSCSLHRPFARPPPPETFLCPISHVRMVDPVVAGDGHTYERAFIEHWLKHKHVSPVTGLACGPRLVPNYTLRSVIVEFKQ